MDPTISGMAAEAFSSYPLNATAALILGPLQVNDSYALLSLTLPILENQDPTIILGYMTVVAAASSLIDVISSREGLASTGLVLIVGPDKKTNQFTGDVRPASTNYTPSTSLLGTTQMKYIFPPVLYTFPKLFVHAYSFWENTFSY